MKNDFVPFLPTPGSAPKAQEAFRLKVVAPAVPAAGFTPIAAHSPAAASPHEACAPSNVVGQPPRVTVQREGDRITHILIQCGCGQVIELACTY